MANLVLILFCLLLIVCVALEIPIVLALSAGLILFMAYGLKQGFSLRALLKMCLSGIYSARNILLTFVLIGMLTALWRASGTIPTIVSLASGYIRPSVFLLLAFLFNCAISFLTGTAFGTAATMGTICATMAAAIGTPPALVGGAVLAGSFYGDRCSPVSTSALLVAEQTDTTVLGNIPGMLKSSALPFVLSCLLCFAFGAMAPHSGSLPDLTALFLQAFRLHWLALIPAALVLLLSLCRLNVKAVLLASILSAIPVCLFLQSYSVPDILRFCLSGFHTDNAAIAPMLNGGGILSMVNVSAIVCISSAYAGIFRDTDLLDQVQKLIYSLSASITPFGATLVTALVTCAIACNQTLAIMLSYQLCRELEPDKEKLAIDLEDSAVIVAPLIPWSIAATVPLATVSAPTISILFAFFLYLLPLWRLAISLMSSKKSQKIH